jgi:hypothetical protein
MGQGYRRGLDVFITVQAEPFDRLRANDSNFTGPE